MLRRTKPNCYRQKYGIWIAKVRISLGAMLGPEGGIQSYPDLKIAIRVERKAAETER
jgi:hypothetical protein